MSKYSHASDQFANFETSTFVADMFDSVERYFSNIRQSEKERLKYFHASLAAVVVYLGTIYFLKIWMKNRKAMDLRYPLALWSLSLALFSGIATAKLLPPFVQVLKTKGLIHTVCDNKFVLSQDVTAFWVLTMGFCKFIELLDTVFILLRKGKLIFLHWYHHATVLVYSWLSYTHGTAAIQWFCTMNYFVHTIMYSYYALRAVRIKIPRCIAMLITTIQIIQMIMGAVVISLAYLHYMEGKECKMNHESALLGFGMYLSYLLLFVQVFRVSYLRKESTNQNGVAKKER